MLNELKNENDKEIFSLIETENGEIKKEIRRIRNKHLAKWTIW